MVRVAHQKSAKQAAPSNSVRSSKVAKQRKNHKVVIESDSQDKENSRAVVRPDLEIYKQNHTQRLSQLSFRADPPPGYTFIPAGNPQLTSALKEFAKKGNHQILAVTTTPHASRHELSREVHRIGFHFPTEVVAQVCNHYGIRLTSGGKLVEEKDDDKLFMRLYQKGQLVLDEKVRDQVTINTEAKQIIQDLFPNIPDNDLFQIIKTAFQLGDGKVGTADEIPLVRRAQLSVVAHIRHTYTNYDKLLRSVPYSEARHRVENITLQKLIDWRGDGRDDKQAMDDTLREVVVISDEEESDEIEEGQLLENDDLRVQPVHGVVGQKSAADGRPRSPIEIHSDEEAPRGYRYLPQVVRRYPVQDPQAVSVARQQSRYAVWDRVRQEYRSGAAPPLTRMVERILLDEPSITQTPASYVSREPLYVPEPPRRILEPAARILAQPSPPTYIRGADGKLYERVVAHPDKGPAPIPLRRPHTPPTDYGRQYIDSRQASPRPQPPLLHRRTDSFENNDGIVLPSIEGPNGAYSSPATRRNPFEESRPALYQRNSGAYDSNRQVPMIDLTSSAEQASKRRRVEETPPSPYLIRSTEHSQNDRDRIRPTLDMPYQYDENQHHSQPSRLIQLENPAASQVMPRAYEKPESRMQPPLLYREEINSRAVQSPRSAGVRQVPFGQASEPYYTQSPRRVEYVNDYDRSNVRPRTEYVSSNVTNSMGDRNSYTVHENLSLHGQPSGYHTESAPRYVRTEVRNPFEAPVQLQYPVSNMQPERNQREYVSSTDPHYPAARDTRLAHVQTIEGVYSQPRMGPPPSNVYRDGQNIRTTYVQN